MCSLLLGAPSWAVSVAAAEPRAMRDTAAEPRAMRDTAAEPRAMRDTAAERDAEHEAPRRWLMVSLQQDLAWVDGRDACAPASQQAGEFSCFRAQGSQYLGTPRDASRLGPGLNLATTRVLLGFQQHVAPRWALGAWAGYVLRGGGPRPVGRSGRAFMPLHLELQASVYPWGAPRRGWGAAPFAFVGGGVAQIDSRASLRVREDAGAPRPPSQLDNPAEQTLDVYKKMGTVFAAAGLGVAVSTSRHTIWRLAAEAMLLAPASGLALGIEGGVGFDL